MALIFWEKSEVLQLLEGPVNDAQLNDRNIKCPALSEDWDLGALTQNPD